MLVIIGAFANAFSAVKLMLELLRGRADDNPTARLGIGAAVYITKVIGSPCGIGRSTSVVRASGRSAVVARVVNVLR